MSNLVRAKHPNGGEFTTSEAYAKRKGLATVDKPTRDQFGRIIPAKPAVSKDGARVDAARANRAELEDAARTAGLSDEQIASASTKADLATLIEEASK